MPFWSADVPPKIVAYASDEEVWALAVRNYYAIVPEDNLWSFGVDGVIPASAPWTLSSASSSFANLTPGMLVRLVQPASIFGDNGESYAVDGVDPAAPDSVLLRRAGLSGLATAGDPPGTPAQDTTAIEWEVRTFLPQLVAASQSLDAAFRVGTERPVPSTWFAPGREPSRENLDSWSLVQMKDICVQMVMRNAYNSAAESMQMTGGTTETFAAKAALADRRLTAMLASFRPRYVGNVDTGSSPRYGRIVRF